MQFLVKSEVSFSRNKMWRMGQYSWNCPYKKKQYHDIICLWSNWKSLTICIPKFWLLGLAGEIMWLIKNKSVFTLSGMLPRQVENIEGSIGISLEKYRSLIGKNTQNIGVYRRSISFERHQILLKYSLLLRFPSRTFNHSTFVIEALPSHSRSESRNFVWRGFVIWGHWSETVVGVLPQKIVKSQMLSDEFWSIFMP